MNENRKRFLLTLIFGILAFLFCVYVLLDTFVITRTGSPADDENLSVFESEAQGNQSDAEKRAEPEIKQNDQIPAEEFEKPFGPEDPGNVVYSDDDIVISFDQYREYNTDIYVANVWLSSAQFLKTAFANDQYGKNVKEKSSVIASQNHAILAINGDNYGSRESGYVIWNGVVYRGRRNNLLDVLCIYPDGRFEITNSDDVSANELVSGGVWQAFSFGPCFLWDGEISIDVKYEIGRVNTKHPRSVLGLVEKLHYVFVVSDGRTDQNEGLTLEEMAKFLLSLGVTSAYNLDGGGSATMVLLGQVVNHPTTNGTDFKERKVSDIVYIAEK